MSTLKNMFGTLGGRKSSKTLKPGVLRTPSAPNLSTGEDFGSPIPGKYKNGTIKRGVMSKEGGRVHTWKTRYFVLRIDGRISYYSVPKNYSEEMEATMDESILKEELGHITIKESTTLTIADTKKNSERKHVFQISSGGQRVFFLCTKTEQEMKQWMDAIQSVITPAPAPSAVPTTPISHSSSFGGSFTQGHLEASSPPVSSAISTPISVQKPAFSASNGSNMSGSADSMVSVASAPGTPLSLPLGMPIAKQLDLLEPSTPRYSEAGSDHDFDVQDEDEKGLVVLEEKETRKADISEEDEYDIAISAIEVFLKPEQDRSPEEHAYVQAMIQYHQQLNMHCKQWDAVPEYSLASGTAILVKAPTERSEEEQQYVKTIVDEYMSAVKNLPAVAAGMPYDVQSLIAVKAAEIFAKTTRTKQEEMYVEQIQNVFRVLKRAQRKHGLSIQHSLLSSSLMLSKYEEEKDVEDYLFSIELEKCTA